MLKKKTDWLFCSVFLSFDNSFFFSTATSELKINSKNTANSVIIYKTIVK